MKEPDEMSEDETAVDARDGYVGDVETAGETTAAVAITGPENPKPVGADTMVKVADATEPEKNV